MAKPRGRGPGEGTIYQRKDGRWVGEVDLGHQIGPDGKRRRRRIQHYGATQREAREKLAEALKKQRENVPVAVDRQTVDDYLHRWLVDVATPKVRPMTLRGYEQIVRTHLVPGLGHHKLGKLSPQHVQELLNAKSAAGLSPRTVHHVRAVLRQALGQAVKWGLVSRNVAALVDPPRAVRHEPAFLTPAQARAFLDAVRDDRLEALYSVAVSLGLRQGEALGLHWRDVDLDQGTLRVRVALQRVGGQARLVEPKSAQSRRTVAMPPSVVAALRAHRARQLRERLAAGERWRDQGLVFATTIGTPLDARNVVRRFKAALRRAGLPDMRWHDLRHTCASLLLAQGVGPRTVMEILGHSQIGLTMNTYAHVMPELKRDAADLMERLLSGDRA